MNNNYTRQEIEDQPGVWENLINNPPRLEEILDKDNVIFFGSGTSHYLALSAASFTQHYTGIVSRGLPSQEIAFFPEATMPDRDTLYVGISRSGETSEVVIATETIRERGKGNIIGITTEIDKPLARLAKRSIVIGEAKEKSVVMTKSFTSMLLAIQLGVLSTVNPSAIDTMKDEFSRSSRKILTIAEAWAKGEAKNNYKEIIFLGSGPLYGIACESALKVREMSASTATAFHSLEFRHGPKASLTKDSFVVILISDSAREEELKIAKEIEDVGSKCTIIGYDLPLSLSEFLRMILYMPFSQYLGYYKALEKGINSDTPINLTRVVRIEE